VWWREVSQDVIPPPPELAMHFGTSSSGDKLALCRTYGNGDHGDGGKRIVGTMPLEGPDMGTCFFTRPDGSTGELIGGLFHILQARHATPSCENSVSLQKELREKIRVRVRDFVNEEDRDLIGRVTGHGRDTFEKLFRSILALGSCELKQILSPMRFFPHELNVQGLHLLRAVLAERMYDARIKAIGFEDDADFLTWKRDGVLIKDWEDVGDEGLHRLLQIVSGEKIEAIPLPPYDWTQRNVAVSGAYDMQHNMHMDSFASVVKVWIFQGVTMEQGPLTYAKGSHRENEARLRWQYAYSLPPAKEALLEPSFRLLGSKDAVKASPEFIQWCKENEVPVLGLPGVNRTLVIADTSGLHRRGEGIVGQVRRSLRLKDEKGDNDGGLKRLDPYRMPPNHFEL